MTENALGLVGEQDVDQLALAGVAGVRERGGGEQVQEAVHDPVADRVVQAGGGLEGQPELAAAGQMKSASSPGEGNMSGVAPPQRTLAPAPSSATARSLDSSPGHTSR